jgi:spermidine/putrescine transport system permease protein
MVTSGKLTEKLTNQLTSIEPTRKITDYLTSIPPFVVALLLGVVPVLILVHRSFSPFFTLENYVEIFTTSIYTQLFIRSLWIGLVATFLCLLIAYPVTFWIAHKLNPKYRVLILVALSLPLWLNYVVLNYTWVTIYARAGLLNYVFTTLGIVSGPLSLLYTKVSLYTGFVYIYLPYVLITLYVSMEQFDYKLIEAARDLGASDIRIFFDIIVPQTIAGVVAGAIIVYARMAGAYITPTVLGGTDNVMIASTIVDAFRVYLDWEFAAAISMLFLVIVIALFSVSAISKDIRQEFKQW